MLAGCRGDSCGLLFSFEVLGGPTAMGVNYISKEGWREGVMPIYTLI